MSKTVKRILIGLLVVLIIIQFFPIDKTNAETDPGQDFLYLTAPPTELGMTIKETCYDCHSNETEYPWYSNVAPINWWIKDHIDEGREELNFSEWSTYNAKKRAHKMEESAELVEEGEMPLPSYTWLHGNARLSEEQRRELVEFFEAQMKKEGGNEVLEEGQEEELREGKSK